MMQVTVAVTPNGRADAVCEVSVTDHSTHHKNCFMLPCQRDMPFIEFIDHAARGSAACHADCQNTQQEHMGSSCDQSSTDNSAKSSEVMYLQQQDNNLRASFPELVHEVEEELQWASEAFGTGPDAVNLWIGNDRSVTSFHKDHYENLYAVVAGEKVFTLLPPSDSYRMQLQQFPVATYHDALHGLQAVLEPDSTVLWSPIEDLTDRSAPPAQQQCPLYADPELPEPLRVVVRPGELLFLPSLWWHQVEQRAGKDGLVIAVNYWYDMQFDCKYAYFKLVESMLTGADKEDSNDDTFEVQN